MNAPRTGWPSAEITRQKTRYQPSGTLRNGVTSVCGSPGAVCGEPELTCCPAASVMETIAKRGSIGSLYVSRTSGGGLFTVRLATGTVLSSAPTIVGSLIATWTTKPAMNTQAP